MKSKKSSFYSMVVCLATLSLVVGSCQKDNVDSLTPDQGSMSLKSMQSSINKDKQDRAILFISKRDVSVDEIYAMNSNGLNVVRLTNNLVADGRATWSANGQHVAFASVGIGTARDIFVMNANGEGLINLTNTTADEDWPEWSPSGNRIVFSSDCDANPAGKHEIYSVNLDGTDLTRLTNRTQDDKWPSYSPDGSKIVFQSNLGTGLGLTDIFVMNADGSDVTQLTNSPAFDQMPAWSPDGTKNSLYECKIQKS